ncbi:MAG: histidine kinase [Acidobacteriales bacterium]|nr:histidine kinase [Terriglobales bacterium]
MSAKPIHERATLPSFGRLLLYSLAVTVGLAGLFTLQMMIQTSMTGEKYPPSEFLFNLSRSLFWGLTAPIILKLGFRFPLDGADRWRNLFRHFLFYLVFSLVHALYRTAVSPYLMPSDTDSKWMMFKVYLTLTANGNLWMYVPLLGASQLMRAFQRVRAREVQAEQLKTELAHSELHALKAQLHPHFLFNTLHSISALIRTNPRSADRMIMRLSDLLRASLDKGGIQEVSLKEELEFLDNYLQIEQVRFQDRLQVRMKIDPEMLDAQVPYLFLQPLAENAIRHGIAQRMEGGQVTVTAARNGDRLCITLEDNGPGLGPKGAVGGIGVANTRARLERLYGAQQSLSIENRREGGVRAKICIPFHAPEPVLDEEMVMEREQI